MPHWHGKLKLLGRIKLMDIRNFTLLMLFSSFTATLIELASIILKYFSNMNGRGKEKVIKKNGQRTSYLPDEACTALNSYQLCPGCFHLPGTQEQSVITSTHRLAKWCTSEIFLRLSNLFSQYYINFILLLIQNYLFCNSSNCIFLG